MRTTLLIITAALLAAPTSASAQGAAPPPSPGQKPASPGETVQAPEPGAFNWTIDVGGLFKGTEGDEARYERYRDDRNGAYTSFSVNRETSSSQFTARAFHVGYRDQRYAADFFGPKVNAAFRWDSLPLNFSYAARTPFA